MKDKLEKLLNYIVKKGANILEILNQYYFIVLYSILLINIFFISILFYYKIYIIATLITLTLIIILKIERLVKVGEINLYDKMNKKILIFNIILLMLNIINIFFNVFRYIFYDVIKVIREFIRNILLDYFEIKINSKIDFYIDNVIAYISWDVVWASIGCFLTIYIYTLNEYFFDWKKNEMLFKDKKLAEKLFWAHSTQLHCDVYMFCWCYWRLWIGSCMWYTIIYKVMVPDLLWIRIGFLLCIICFIIASIYTVQFQIAYYKFLWKKR